MSYRFLKKIFTITGRKIIQFSPQRSGSTLVFNILKDLFPTRYVDKKHSYTFKDKNFPTVTTYRHPYDCIGSLILKDQVQPTNQIIEEKISLFRKDGWNDLINQFDSPNILFLRYEDFCNDMNFLLNSIESYFNINIEKDKRIKLMRKYEIKNIKNNLKKFKNFNEYDKQTHFHGNHISKFLGSPNYYKKLFNENQIKILDKYFYDEKKYLNYE